MNILTRALIVVAALFLAAGCTTTKPDGTVTQVDSKAVKVITKSAIEVAADILDAYLRYIAPAPTQTLYDGPRVITSEVPRP